MSSSSIEIRNARTHNLRNLSVEIPHRALTVVTGPSGSGKSSLAFDTLYAESQRRFVESMSTYVRQFLERMTRPDADSIDGILPALAIEQKNSVTNARSSVATATELADYMRLFMTWAGEAHCRDCDAVVRRETPQTIADSLLDQHAESRCVVVAPLTQHDATTISELRAGGFHRVWSDGEITELSDRDSERETLELVIDRLQIREDRRERLIEALEQGLAVGAGNVVLYEKSDEGWTPLRFNTRFSCNRCGVDVPVPRPQLFSFNSPLGACPHCQGYGRVIGVDWDKVIPDRRRALSDRPIEPFNSPSYAEGYDDLERVAGKAGLRLDVPIEELTEREQEILWDGEGSWYGLRGFFNWLESKKYKVHVRVLLSRYRKYEPCSECDGTRLRPESLAVTFRSRTIADFYAMTIGEAREFWDYLPLTREEEEKVGHLRREILNRLIYLDEVGLSYLSLDRQTRTLSGGEAQRINLAAALGNGLTQTLYVVDEPTVGLHSRDSDRLLGVLHRLRNSGNTVLVVEHDPAIIAGADHLIEIGPGAGQFGGTLVDSGPATEERVRHAAYGDTNDEADPWERRDLSSSPVITIRGARENNLQGIDVSVPLGGLVAVTGVSGSGKSTLIEACLYNGYRRREQQQNTLDVGAFDSLKGTEQIADMELVDQSPIGRSSRSNPATYIKAWDEIRKVLAAEDAKVEPRDFSFNVSGGRCETCLGSGTVTIDMHFMADVDVTCDTCQGRRFKPQILAVRHRGKNVEDILAMTVDEAHAFFIRNAPLTRKLRALRSVGLGYLTLGQSTATLSGGEAQRLKLASFLLPRKETGSRLFLFDEPTTGLHSTDIGQLLKTFRELNERGHSVLVIEHNLDVIRKADWIIDLGPEGGDEGGRVVAEGPPEKIAENEASITGRYLAKELASV